MLVQSGFRTELGTALCACELSFRGRTCAGCLHHCTQGWDYDSNDCNADGTVDPGPWYESVVSGPAYSCYQQDYAEYHYVHFHFSIEGIRVNDSHLSRINRRRGAASPG